MSYLLGQAGDRSSVVFEVTPHQVAGSQGRHQAQLASQDGAGHNPGQLCSVLACRQEMLSQGERGREGESEDVPGLTGWGPLTPNISRHEDWAGRMVPPPTVPT